MAKVIVKTPHHISLTFLREYSVPPLIYGKVSHNGHYEDTIAIVGSITGSHEQYGEEKISFPYVTAAAIGVLLLLLAAAASAATTTNLAYAQFSTSTTTPNVTTTPQAAPATGGTPFVDEEHGFRLLVPSGWIVDDANDYGDSGNEPLSDVSLQLLKAGSIPVQSLCSETTTVHYTKTKDLAAKE